MAPRAGRDEPPCDPEGSCRHRAASTGMVATAGLETLILLIKDNAVVPLKTTNKPIGASVDIAVPFKRRAPALPWSVDDQPAAAILEALALV